MRRLPVDELGAGVGPGTGGDSGEPFGATMSPAQPAMATVAAARSPAAASRPPARRLTAVGRRRSSQATATAPVDSFRKAFASCDRAPLGSQSQNTPRSERTRSS